LQLRCVKSGTMLNHNPLPPKCYVSSYETFPTVDGFKDERMETKNCIAERLPSLSSAVLANKTVKHNRNLGIYFSSHSKFRA